MYLTSHFYQVVPRGSMCFNWSYQIPHGVPSFRVPTGTPWNPLGSQVRTERRRCWLEICWVLGGMARWEINEINSSWIFMLYHFILKIMWLKEKKQDDRSTEQSPSSSRSCSIFKDVISKDFSPYNPANVRVPEEKSTNGCRPMLLEDDYASPERVRHLAQLEFGQSIQVQSSDDENGNWMLFRCFLDAS